MSAPGSTTPPSPAVSNDAPPKRSRYPYIGKDIPIDPQVLNQLEEQAVMVAENLDTMMKNVQERMYEACNATQLSFSVYEQSVNDYQLAISEAAKNMRELIELCDALNQEFNGVTALASRM
ncbi:3487_t:CDS:2 [Paraglomus brasilianum]|uniref:3487_t:CDS:1 n=1 Tax=Paraglomus brasilianum TaxID=144538 RepID=A0A9N9AKD7_9GLOM|nr:3487_t:CDS:2 [Paraglomus brasilianum]